MQYKRFGVQINVKRTKIFNLTVLGQATPNICINTDGQRVEAVDESPYLISNNITCEEDFEERIKSTHTTYGTLSHWVFSNHGLNIKPKSCSGRWPSTTFWTLRCRDIKRLERYQQTKLRRNLLLTWEDITNNEVLSQTYPPSIETTIFLDHLCWADYMSTRLRRTILFGELASGKRPRGCPRRLFNDHLKTSQTEANIDSNTWETVAVFRYRTTWRESRLSGPTVNMKSMSVGRGGGDSPSRVQH